MRRFEKRVSPGADTIEHQKLIGLGRGVRLVDDGERLGTLNVCLVLRWSEAGLQGMCVTPEGFVACSGDMAGAAAQLPVACLVPATLLYGHPVITFEGLRRERFRRAVLH